MEIIIDVELGKAMVSYRMGEDRCSNSGSFMRVIEGWTPHAIRYVIKRNQGARWKIK